MCDRACEGEPEQREHNSDCDQTDLPRYVPSRARPSSQQLCHGDAQMTYQVAVIVVVPPL